MEQVVLKNGSSEPEVLVKTTMLSLKSLWDGGLPGVLAVSDLKALCDDPAKDVMYIDMLKDRALVDGSGKVNTSIKSIVLSACEGDGFEMRLTSPVAA